MNFSKFPAKLALAAALSVASLPQAFAATNAGQSVSNTATVNYKVGTIDQTPVNSLPAVFLVDRVINHTVVRDQVSINVTPNATTQVLAFTVTNNSNSPQDFLLSAVESAVDDFDVTSYAIYVDNPVTGTVGAYDVGDTLTFVDELAGNGATRKVFVVATIPAGAADTDFADVALIAQAAQSVNGTTGAYVATVGTAAAAATESNVGAADNTAFIDTVFGDGTGATGVAGVTDAVEDGRYSAVSRYVVVTATLAVTKTSRVYSDPFNGTTNPKAIPGAEIEYCLAVENTGAAAASTIALTDNLPVTYVSFVALTLEVATDATTNDCTTGTFAAGGSYTSPTVTVNTASIPAAGRFVARFRVLVL